MFHFKSFFLTSAPCHWHCANCCSGFLCKDLLWLFTVSGFSLEDLLWPFMQRPFCGFSLEGLLWLFSVCRLFLTTGCYCARFSLKGFWPLTLAHQEEPDGPTARSTPLLVGRGTTGYAQCLFRMYNVLAFIDFLCTLYIRNQ